MHSEYSTAKHYTYLNLFEWRVNLVRLLLAKVKRLAQGIWQETETAVFNLHWDALFRNSF